MPTNPAFAAHPVFVPLSEVEYRWLLHHAEASGLSVPNLLRQAVGLPARHKGAPTHADRVATLGQAATLCEQIGLVADEYLVPALESPRPVGRPRKGADEPTEEVSAAKQAEWEMHRQMNEAMAQLGYTNLPSLPTNREEEIQYRSEGHGRR